MSEPVDTSAENVERVAGHLAIMRETNQIHPEDCDYAAALLRALAAERDQLRETNRGLHRRAQEHERGEFGKTTAGLRHDLDVAHQRLSEQETLLAERNRQNAAAFAASSAYEKRCEQGDALLREASKYVSEAAAACAKAESLELAIDAHLAGEAMGAREGK